MNKINIGLIGYGTVGRGVVQILQRERKHFKDKFNTDFVLKTLCDLKIREKEIPRLAEIKMTTKFQEILDDPEIHVVIELIGGMHPADEIVSGALSKGKHVITANKELIANNGKKLFQLAKRKNRHLYFESSVGAGIPIISAITEGVAGNRFKSLYGIINGTCNFILTEMTKKNYTFGQALKEAKKKGFAERNPILDINGMDSTHKLAILIYLAFGKLLKVKNIYTEGITHISHDDIEHAESLNLTIKLLAIAKKEKNKIEARVHPTLISKEHPLSSINGIYNAIYLHADPLGNVLLSGEGAGQMAAASGVISNLISLAAKGHQTNLLCNLHAEDSHLRIRKIDQIQTKFYLRFMATDKPGVLSKISGILGKYGISINSVTQKVHNPASTVPVVMLTDYTTEKKLRLALNKIHKLPIVKSKPVAIRMEKLW